MRKAASDFMLSSTRPKYCYNFSWQSRPIIQYPQDMVAMQEIIWKVKARFNYRNGYRTWGVINL